MAKKKLILLGGGDFCREVLWAAQFILAGERDWEPVSILDDHVDAARKHMRHRGVALPVSGAIADHQPKPDEVFIPAIGNTRYKLKAAELLESRGAQFINLIHPTALIAPDACLGKGIFIFMNSVVSVGSQVEDFVTVNASVLVGHDAVIGRGCNLNPHAVVTGNVKLGRGVQMGTHSSIAPNYEAGDFATVGAGSAAIGMVASGLTVLGVPAKAISPARKEMAAAQSCR